MIAVIARRHDQFTRFLRGGEIPREEHKNYRYISRVEDTRGVWFTEVKYIEDYRDKPDWGELAEAVHRRIKPATIPKKQPAALPAIRGMREITT